MKNFLQSFPIVAPILTLLILTIGCNAENPICTTNFCAVGEVFPRSELDTANFSEVDIDDSVIFATLVDIPQPVEVAPIEPDIQTAPADSVALADIVADVARNGTNSVYKGQTVTITGAVDFTFKATATRNSGITLHTHNKQIVFFVNDDEGVDDLAHLANGSTYTFTLLISDVKPSSSNPEKTNIWSDAKKRPSKANVDIETVTMAQIVSNVARGGKQYLGKTIKVRATVSFALLKTSGLISLSTNNANVGFNILDTQNPENLSRYNSNVAYNFTLYIYDIKQDEDNFDEYDIAAQIAND